MIPVFKSRFKPFSVNNVGPVDLQNCKHVHSRTSWAKPEQHVWITAYQLTFTSKGQFVWRQICVTPELKLLRCELVTYNFLRYQSTIPFLTPESFYQLLHSTASPDVNTVLCPHQFMLQLGVTIHSQMPPAIPYLSNLNLQMFFAILRHESVDVTTQFKLWLTTHAIVPSGQAVLTSRISFNGQKEEQHQRASTFTTAVLQLIALQHFFPSQSSRIPKVRQLKDGWVRWHHV